MNQKLSKIIDLSGRLRFQKRWAQTPRIPETSVLGHMFIVAIFSYFFSKKVKACEKRVEFNFFCALFHDFPESLTRDIITPVKYGIAGLDEIISDYEMRLIDEKILPNVPANFRDEFSYILGIRKQEEKTFKNEFENRIFENFPKEISASLSNFNENKFRPIDGKAIKFCDKIAAYFEAGISINYGVKTKELIMAFKKMHENFKQNPKIEGIDFFEICEKFVDFFELKEFIKTP